MVAGCNRRLGATGHAADRTGPPVPACRQPRPGRGRSGCRDRAEPPGRHGARRWPWRAGGDPAARVHGPAELGGRGRGAAIRPGGAARRAGRIRGGNRGCPVTRAGCRAAGRCRGADPAVRSAGRLRSEFAPPVAGAGRRPGPRPAAGAPAAAPGRRTNHDRARHGRGSPIRPAARRGGGPARRVRSGRGRPGRHRRPAGRPACRGGWPAGTVADRHGRGGAMARRSRDHLAGRCGRVGPRVRGHGGPGAGVPRCAAQPAAAPAGRNDGGQRRRPRRRRPAGQAAGRAAA